MTSTEKLKLCVTTAAAFLAMAFHALPARATPLTVDGFALSISESILSSGGLSQALQNAQKLIAQDRPMISIQNTSTSASITSFSLTMGNSAFGFGSLTMLPQHSTAKISAYTPTTLAGQHAGASLISLTFGTFVPNQTFDFRTDIDRLADGGMSLTNYRQALASGSDPSNWATVNVVFSDGATLQQVITPSSISGAPQNPLYSYFYCLHTVPPTGQINIDARTTPSEPIPEPATWLMALMAAVGMLLAGTARRRVSRI